MDYSQYIKINAMLAKMRYSLHHPVKAALSYGINPSCIVNFFRAIEADADQKVKLL
ncbi:hypothetical protein D3C77_603010 [compost metagenome]